MASLHRQHGKPNWFCAYTDADGTRRFKSTGTPDKEKAEVVCNTLAKSVKLSRKKQLTPQRARKLLTNALAEIMEATGESLQKNPTKDFLETWLEDAKGRITTSTYNSYKAITKRFIAHLEDESSNQIDQIGIEHIRSYRTEIAKEFSTGTVNNHLKMLRKVFETAQEQDLVDRNPAKLIKNLSRIDKQERRPFSIEELRAVLRVANEDWKTAILLGLYTGLRLGDVQQLTWEQVDLKRQEISKKTTKTGRTVIIPLAPPLSRHLANLRHQRVQEGIFSRAFSKKPTKRLSNEFHDILVSAGLVEKRNYKNHRSDGKRRKYSGLSYHCLRHSTTSMLKNAGVTEAIAGDIVGHDSEAMSRNYTKIDSATKKEAIDRLPDITEA